MARKEEPEIIADEWYSASEAAPLLNLKEGTVKKRLRDGLMTGKQVGPKKVWHVKGTEILKFRKEWNLDGI